MKSLFQLALAVSMLALISCQKENVSPAGTNLSNLSVPATQMNNAAVTFFTKNGTNETNNFKGYTFKFDCNGLLTATTNGVTVSGNWSIYGSTGERKAIIHFDAAPLNKLNGTWDISEESSAVLRMQIAGNSSTDLLTFEK